VPTVTTVRPAVCACSASTAYGTAPSLVRGSGAPSSTTSTQRSLLAWIGATHDWASGTVKWPLASGVVAGALVVHTWLDATVPPVATFQILIARLWAEVTGWLLASSSTPE